MYLLGKFSQILEEKFIFRSTEKKHRTKEDFEILKVVSYDNTEFGIQGSLFCWYGDGKDFDWENYDYDDWGARAFFFGFQNFLEFYTTPTKEKDKNKLVIYTPFDSWTDGHIIIDEIEYPEHLNNQSVEDLLCLLLNTKYSLMHISTDYVSEYIGDISSN